jgi:hypothetical protein
MLAATTGSAALLVAFFLVVAALAAVSRGSRTLRDSLVVHACYDYAVVGADEIQDEEIVLSGLCRSEKQFEALGGRDEGIQRQHRGFDPEKRELPESSLHRFA